MPAVVLRPGPPQTSDLTDAAAADDTHHAVRNALKLGGSLLLTLGLSFGVKLLLPRYLGPELTGSLLFAEAFATSFFVAVNLGVDIYIRREIPVRPEHASDFAGGIVALRVGVSALVFVAMAAVMQLGNKPADVQRLVYVYGLAQVLVAMNQSVSALLHSKGQVNGLSVSNVATKALWGALIVGALALHRGLLGIPLALLLSEAVELVILLTLARRHLGLRWVFNLPATWAVVVASLPFYLNLVAHTAYNKLDLNMLSFMSNDREVGWYGAASNLAGLTLLMTPLIGWVLMPLYSKAAGRSDDELNQILRRSLELILTLSFPVSLMMGLGADFWIALAFGKAFAPAALALRILAPVFLVTYVAMLGATCLVNMKRSWTMTFISLFGLALAPVLDYVFIRKGLALLGSSGGGAGSAVANVLTEIVVTTVIMCFVGTRAFDRRSLTAIGKTVLVSLGVIGADWLMRPLGASRIALDAVLYIVGVVGSGALRVTEMTDFLRSALQRKRENAA